MKTFFFAMAFLLFASAGHAAGFDCAKASTRVEKMICSDAALSALDDSLTESYRKALANAKDAEALRAQQRTWLANARNKCVHAACLTRVYEERLSALNSGTAPSVSTDGGVTGTYQTKSGELKVQQLPGARIKFQVFSSFKTNTGEASGEAPLKGDTATYVNRAESCGLVFRFAANTATIAQDGTCGMGLNVSASGNYKRSNRESPKFD